MMYSKAALVLALVNAARAVNDWNVPCLSGECSWGAWLADHSAMFTDPYLDQISQVAQLAARAAP